MLEFEWNPAKARANERKHGVSFEFAKQAFDDPLAVAAIDDREDYGEERLFLIGAATDVLLFVAYTERGDRIRMISARYATRREREIYDEQIAKLR